MTDRYARGGYIPHASIGGSSAPPNQGSSGQKDGCRPMIYVSQDDFNALLRRVEALERKAAAPRVFGNRLPE